MIDMDKKWILGKYTYEMNGIKDMEEGGVDNTQRKKPLIGAGPGFGR